MEILLDEAGCEWRQPFLSTLNILAAPRCQIRRLKAQDHTRRGQIAHPQSFRSHRSSAATSERALCQLQPSDAISVGVVKTRHEAVSHCDSMRDRRARASMAASFLSSFVKELALMRFIIAIMSLILLKIYRSRCWLFR